MNWNSIKISFIQYLIAYILGRFTSRIIGYGMEVLNITPKEGASVATVLIFFFVSAFLATVVMGLTTTWVFLNSRKLPFSFSLAFIITAGFVITTVGIMMGVAAIALPPQLLLVGVPLQFLYGLYFVSRHVEKNEGVT